MLIAFFHFVESKFNLGSGGESRRIYIFNVATSRLAEGAKSFIREIGWNLFDISSLVCAVGGQLEGKRTTMRRPRALPLIFSLWVGENFSLFRGQQTFTSQGTKLQNRQEGKTWRDQSEKVWTEKKVERRRRLSSLFLIYVRRLTLMSKDKFQFRNSVQTKGIPAALR